MPAIPVENLKTMEVWFGLSNEDALKKVGDLATLLGHNADEYRKAFIERKDAFEKAEAARKLRERQAELVKAINGQGLEDVDVALIVEAVKSGVRISIGTELNPDGQDIPVLEAGSTAPGATRTRGPLVSTGSRSPQQFQYFYNGMPLEPGERLSRHILANHEDSVAAAALKAYKDKPNKSKLGAWEAVQRDPDLSKLYTREPKASA